VIKGDESGDNIRMTSNNLRINGNGLYFPYSEIEKQDLTPSFNEHDMDEYPGIGTHTHTHTLCSVD